MNGPSGTLHIEDHGRGGVPVVFVHSLGGSSGQWASQVGHLASHRRAVAFDLRGHGRSTLVEGAGARVEDFADDLAAVLDRLELPRVVLVGHSLGGAVVIHYAGAHPERVAGLLLLDPSSDGRLVPKAEAEGMIQALRQSYTSTIEAYWRSMLEASTEAVRERVLADLRQTAPQVVIGALTTVLEFDPVTPLSRYSGPRRALITALNETPAALQERVPGLVHARIEGTGHWLQLDAPELVNRALDEFLRESASLTRDRCVDYVEFVVRDLAVAQDFYRTVFGWSFTDYGPSYAGFTDGRREGGFTTDGTRQPSGGPLVIIYCEGLEAALGRVVDAGGVIVRSIFEFPGGRRFQFRDPDGYELGVWSDR